MRAERIEELLRHHLDRIVAACGRSEVVADEIDRALALPADAPASAEAVAVEAFRQGWARCLAANSDRFVLGCKALLPTQDDEDRAVAHALRAG